MAHRLVEVDVQRVVLDHRRKAYVVLGERVGHRILPIPIGLNEASAIVLALRNEQVARPLTHDLMANMIRELDAEVRSVVVVEYKDEIFHARLDVSCDGDSHSVDARPSDAIALALRLQSRIFVDDGVLSAAGTTTEDADRWAGAHQHEREREIEQFRDLLSDLNLDPGE